MIIVGKSCHACMEGLKPIQLRFSCLHIHLTSLFVCHTNKKGELLTGVCALDEDV